MIFVLLIAFAQANLVIRDDYFGMYLYSWNGEYTIMVRSGVNFTRGRLAVLIGLTVLRDTIL